MKTVRDTKCVCGGGLMPLWKTSNWFCIECKLEQSLSKDKKPVDKWYK